MPRKDRIAQKREEQARRTAERKAAQATQPPRDYDAELKVNDQAQRAAEDALRTFWERVLDTELAFKGTRHTGHFVGEGSTAVNERLRPLQERCRQLGLQRQAILNHQNPGRPQLLAQQKREQDESQRARLLFWAHMLPAAEGRALAAQAERTPKIDREVEVVQRLFVGVLLAAESPTRCYHWRGDTQLPCDCHHDSPRGWTLSERAQALYRQNRLVVRDRVAQAQELQLQWGPPVSLNGFGGFSHNADFVAQETQSQ